MAARKKVKKSSTRRTKARSTKRYTHLSRDAAPDCLHGYGILPFDGELTAKNVKAYLQLVAQEIGVLEATQGLGSDTDWEQMRPDDYATFSWATWKRELMKIVKKLTKTVPLGDSKKLLDTLESTYDDAFEATFARGV